MDNFLEALKEKDYEYLVYWGDFLPEIEDPGRWGQDKDMIEYWSGYYSSKPVYKQLIRDVFKNLRLTQSFVAYVAYQQYLN